MKRHGNHKVLSTAGFATLATGVVLLSSVFVSTAVAAEPAKKDSNDKRGGYQLENMIVTAQKQEENVQEVPISISVLDSVLIEDAGIDTLVRMSNYIPNLFLYEQSPGNNLPTMRGLSAPVETYQVSTGLYIDGAPIITTTGFTTGLLDIERVEVLRGPQGTLYGNGAQAGVINITTRRPSNEFTGKISTEAGSGYPRKLIICWLRHQCISVAL